MKRNFAGIVFVFLFFAVAGEVFAETEGADPALMQNLKVEQERMREQMDIIKREMQVIMQEITESMRQDNDRLRAELENLRSKTDQLRQEIAGIFKREQVLAKAEMSGLRSEMERSQVEAGNLKEALAVALEIGKQDWKKSAEVMRSILADSRQNAVTEKIKSAEVLNETRAASRINQEEQKLVLDSSRGEVLSSLNSTIKNLGGSKQSEQNSERIKRETVAALDDAKLQMQENLVRYKKEAESEKEKVVKSPNFEGEEKKIEIRAKTAPALERKRVEALASNAATPRAAIGKKKEIANLGLEDKAVSAQPIRPAGEKPLDERLAKVGLSSVEKKKEGGAEKAVAEQQKKVYGKTALEKVDRRSAGDKKAGGDTVAAPDKDFGSRALSKGIDASKPSQDLAGLNETGKDEAGKRNAGRDLQKQDERKPDRKIPGQERPEEVEAAPAEEELADYQGETAVDSLAAHKKKLGDLSDEIKALKDQLRKNKADVRPTLVSVGKLYLESQRYLNSMIPGDRMKILHFADRAGTILGSYEMTIWSLKSALRYKADDADLNLFIGEVYEETHDASARYYAKRAGHLLAKTTKQKVEADKVQVFVNDIKKRFS